jgi:purine nucleoside phosphorylase
VWREHRLQAGVAKAFEAQGVKVGEAAYMAFQGPSLPSNAEAAIAHKIGCPLVGTASLYAPPSRVASLPSLPHSLLSGPLTA